MFYVQTSTTVYFILIYFASNLYFWYFNDEQFRFFGFLNPVALRPNAGNGLLIHEVSRSNITTQNSVGLLWTSDQPVAETST